MKIARGDTALESMRRREKTRPCMPSSTLVCQITWLELLTIGLRNSRRVAAIPISTIDSRMPTRLTRMPLTAMPPMMAATSRLGVPRAPTARLPATAPRPAMDSTAPAAASVENDTMSGMTNTLVAESMKLTPA